MKGLTLLSLGAILADYAAAQSNVGTSGKVQFCGVGYDSTYQPIKKIELTKKKCECTLGDAEWFSGVNAPLSENLAVHVRGPVGLSKFAFYQTDNFVVGGNSSDSWNRTACFDNTGSSPAVNNITFLAHVGAESECMGPALSYVTDDGLTPAKVNGIPSKDMKVPSGVEYVMFSNVSCPASKAKNSCGIYPKGIPAYQGFGGVTKMFLFEFTMPTDLTTEANDSSVINAPSIWLSSDSLPRVTSKYTTDNNCSCLFKGCGAYEVFSANSTLMTSSLVTFQGINPNTTAGVQALFNNTANGYFNRPTNGTVCGGVVFDSEGHVVTFVSTNGTSFDEVISGSTVQSLLSGLPELGDNKVIAAGTETAPAPKTKKTKTKKSKTPKATATSSM
ncbi:hypothetical protein DAKH74_026850 [Maudiozyma humilis]|uniref:glucan endo-1,3-beta-D-glucosidase n=1 Tax=Maudiozyma humilis TaxID=51915 RepID=A0AAV5RWS2_MAUHU|nr:hypothetical protein DAKH74_026850 [Kazachstania humilis]